MPIDTKKVLLVDDEERLLSALRRRLSNTFNIVTATSGREALQLIDDDPDIAVIVADMKMREMDGVELLNLVKKKNPRIRRLMLTGNTDLTTAIAAINEGRVMRFLRKPSDAETLIGALSQALAEHAFQSTDRIDEPQQDPSVDIAAKARDTFLSVISHELRTPLNHIIGSSEILRNTSKLADEPKLSELLEQIYESGEDLLWLINRILYYSQLQSRPPDEDRSETVNLISVIEKEIAQVKPMADDKNITISLDSLHEDMIISARMADVQFAVKELLCNAVKFNAVNGHVSVLVNCDAEKAALKVLDDGDGVPTELFKQITEPFRQADEGWTRRYEGVGLGLTIVLKICALNNASFTLASRPGGGTEATLVFRHALPRGQEARSA